MLRGYLVNEKYASPEEMDLDLAKKIGDYQYEQQSSAPKNLLALKRLILQEALAESPSTIQEE